MSPHELGQVDLSSEAACGWKGSHEETLGKGGCQVLFSYLIFLNHTLGVVIDTLLAGEWIR